MMKVADNIGEAWVSDGATMARTLARFYGATAILGKDWLGQEGIHIFVPLEGKGA